MDTKFKDMWNKIFENFQKNCAYFDKFIKDTSKKFKKNIIKKLNSFNYINTQDEYSKEHNDRVNLLLKVIKADQTTLRYRKKEKFMENLRSAIKLGKYKKLENALNVTTAINSTLKIPDNNKTNELQSR